MPFIGQDWRAPGDVWIRGMDGCWEQQKLIPAARNSSDCSLDSRSAVSSYSNRIRNDSDSSNDILLFPCPSPIDMQFDDQDIEENEKWQPHCFVKTGKSKEFVGCTSMKEAFYKLDLSGAVADVRKFNYVCKVAHILIKERLTGLSYSARKILLELVETLVLHSVAYNGELNTCRGIVSELIAGLTSSKNHHCGSPKLLTNHQDTVTGLYDLLTNLPDAVEAPFDCSSEDSITFIDLPLECLRSVLRRLSDHESLLTAAEAHHALLQIVDAEHSVWEDLSRFHFTEPQIDKIQEKLRNQKLRAGEKLFDERPKLMQWRSAYFELKKFYGLRELYADMIHICCHCKALFWNGIGHPCVAREPAPSVRVTPHQFIEMLCASN